VRAVVAIVVAGCGFHPRPGAGVDALAASPDAPPPFCGSDPNLVLCFSFDQVPLPDPLSNEGHAAAAAQLTNAGSIASPMGNAAKVDTTSEIYLPYAPQVTGVLAMEIWIRMDVDPANGGRASMFDSNIGPNNMSLFYNRHDPTYDLRCGLGAGLVVMAAALPVSSWHYLACTCDGANIVQYVDGVAIGSQAQPCSNAGAFEGDGFTIGQNNNGNNGAGVNDWLTGAIDGIRLWSVPLSAHDACVRAGRSGC
jgi:hypothetical protein